MTDDKDDTWSEAEMLLTRRQLWSVVVADCSTPALQPQETHGHSELIDRLMAPATSICQRVDGAQTATSSKLWCQLQAVSQIRRCCAVHTVICQNTQLELGLRRDT